MKIRFAPARLAIAIMLTGLLVLSGCAAGSSSAGSTKSVGAPSASIGVSKGKAARVLPSYVRTTGEVILLRGLANIFSKGMDVIGDRLKARGVDAQVYNHRSWESLAIDIVARSRQKKISYPIIIMGHSLGANASVQMATYLGKRGIPVSYVVAFDPTVATFAGPKIRNVVNYYIPNGENIVRRGRGFTGKLANINVSRYNGIKHTNVEKNRRLQNRAINRVMKLVKKRRKRR